MVARIVGDRKPVIEGVSNVIEGNFYRSRKALLVAGFVLGGLPKQSSQAVQLLIGFITNLFMGAILESKKIVLIGVIAVVLLAGGGAIYYFASASSSPSGLSHDEAATLILAHQKQNEYEGGEAMNQNGYGCSNPLNLVQPESIAITGITYPKQNYAEALFTETDELTPNGVACTHSVTSSITSKQTAVFQLYDSGWQITEIAPYQQ